MKAKGNTIAEGDAGPVVKLALAQWQPGSQGSGPGSVVSESWGYLSGSNKEKAVPHVALSDGGHSSVAADDSVSQVGSRSFVTVIEPALPAQIHRFAVSLTSFSWPPGSVADNALNGRLPEGLSTYGPSIDCLCIGFELKSLEYHVESQIYWSAAVHPLLVCLIVACHTCQC